MGEGNGKKKVYGLLGHGIGYSLSPIMHGHAFTHFALNSGYNIYDIEEKRLPEFIEGLFGGVFSGMNVTVPYKVAVFDLLKGNENSVIEALALKIGAINTLVSTDGRIEACNTDGPGFALSLREDLGISEGGLEGANAIVLGAGGAGRAVSFSLLGSGFDTKTVIVTDVDLQKAEHLASDLIEIFGEGAALGVKSEDIYGFLRGTELIVNATPLGTCDDDPPPIDIMKAENCSASLYDLIYARETRLVSRWKEKGLPSCGGLGMLVSQAALSFDLWTGGKLSVDEIKSVMREALPENLKKGYRWNIR